MTVYVARCSRSGLIKIGYSSALVVRLRTIQGESAYLVELMWQSKPGYGRIAERNLHRLFEGYRCHGEWFDFGAADPVKLVSAAIDLPKPADRSPEYRAAIAKSRADRVNVRLSVSPSRRQLGKELAYLRVAARISGRVLCNQVGLTNQVAVSRVERAEAKISRTQLKLWVEATGASEGELLRLTALLDTAIEEELALRGLFA